MLNTNIFKSENQHLKIASQKLEKFGITYLSYGVISDGKILSDVFSHKEWRNHYKENHYEKRDPLVQGVLRSNLPLIIWDALHPFGDERKVMVERNEMCGIQSGLTIGIKNAGTTEIIALGAKITSHDFYLLLNDEKHMSTIHGIVREFYSYHKKLTSKTSC